MLRGIMIAIALGILSQASAKQNTPPMSGYTPDYQIYSMVFGGSTSQKSQNQIRSIFVSKDSNVSYFSGCAGIAKKVNMIGAQESKVLAKIMIITGISADDCQYSGGQYIPAHFAQSPSKQLFIRLLGQGRDKDGNIAYSSFFMSSMPPVCDYKQYRKMDKKSREMARILCEKERGGDESLYFSF